MVFSKIMDNIKNIINESKIPEKRNYNKKPIDNLLKQGKQHQKLKNKKIKNFNKKKHIIENNKNFDKGDKLFDEGLDKSRQYLTDLRTDFQNDLSSWGNNQKTFIDNYNLLLTKINECKRNCVDKVDKNKENRTMRIDSCINGCRLREPELLAGSDNKNVNCSGVRCINRNIMPGAENIVTNEQKDGCFKCGGGFGGTPIIRSKGKSGMIMNVTSCNNMDEAYGKTGKDLKQACMIGYNYFQDSIDSNGNYTINKNIYNFTDEYAKLLKSNENLNSRAKDLEKQTNSIRKKRKNIMSVLSKLEGMKSMSDLIEDYNDVYARTSLERKSTDTQKGQLEDIELKLSSQQIQLYLWSGLAILTMLLVIQKIRQ